MNEKNVIAQARAAAPEPGNSDSLADRIFNLPCNWKGDPALAGAVQLGHTMACEQAYKLVRAAPTAPTDELPACDAPKGPYADYSAEEVEAFAKEYARTIIATRTLSAPTATSEPVAAFPERDLSKPAEQQGLFRKFEVRRVDGSDQPGGKHHGCRYYVLDLNHDQHAPAAMRAYAASCRATHPQLADDIEAEFAAPAPQQAAPLTVHTPEFRKLMTEYDDEANYGSLNKARANLVAFINAKIGVSAGSAASAGDARDAIDLLRRITGGMWIDEIAEERDFVRKYLQEARALIAKADAAPATQRAADAQDAQRYRYVRATTTAIREPETGERIECTPELFDQAIDKAIDRAAMAATKEKKQ